jgi:hypothetical protein
MAKRPSLGLSPAEGELSHWLTLRPALRVVEDVLYFVFRPSSLARLAWISASTHVDSVRRGSPARLNGKSHLVVLKLEFRFR